MPETEEVQPQPQYEPGMGDLVLDDMGRQLANKSAELAMARARIVLMEKEYGQKIDELTKAIEDLQAAAVKTEESFKDLGDAHNTPPPKVETKVKHNGRTTERVKADG